LVYDGAGLIVDIKKELAQCLRQDGFKNIKDAVGVDVQ
jgi:dihydroorotate dehydrogenase